MDEPAVIPPNLFGNVPEHHYADLGRVAMLAALLDQRLHDLYVQMFGVDQATDAGAAGTKLIPRCQERLEVIAPDQRVAVADFLVAALGALRQRNAVLHSLWVFPGADNDYGWRHPSARALRGTVTTERVDQVPQLVRDLVDLTVEALSLASSIRQGEPQQKGDEP